MPIIGSIYVSSRAKAHKKTIVVAIVAALAIVISPVLPSSELANVKDTTNTSCTNAGGQTVDNKTTCPSSPPQTHICASTTGNEKCPPGQNK